MLRRSGHNIGDVITVSISGQETPIEIVDRFGMFPTITNTNQQVLIADLNLITQHVNASSLYTQLAANEVWLSYKEKPEDPTTFAKALGQSSLSPKPFVSHSTVIYRLETASNSLPCLKPLVYQDYNLLHHLF